MALVPTAQVITYRITTVRVNDEPIRDVGAAPQAQSKDSASGNSGANGLPFSFVSLEISHAWQSLLEICLCSTTLMKVQTIGQTRKGSFPIVSCGFLQGDRPDVPHTSAGSAAAQSAAAAAAAAQGSTPGQAAALDAEAAAAPQLEEVRDAEADKQAVSTRVSLG